MSAVKLLSSFALQREAFGPLIRGGGDAKVDEANVAKRTIASSYHNVRGDFCITIFSGTLEVGGLSHDPVILQIKRHSQRL